MALKPCPQCGKMISDKAERCPKCGLDVKSLYLEENSQGTQNINNPPINEKAVINNTSTQPPNYENPSHQGDPSVIKEPSYNEVSSYTENPKKSRTGIWICVCIILAVGIGAAIWIPIYKHNEKIKAEHLALLEQQRLDSIAAVEAEMARLEQMRLDSIEFENSHRLTADIWFTKGATLMKNHCLNTIKNMDFEPGEIVNTGKVDGEVEYELFDSRYIPYYRTINGRKIEIRDHQYKLLRWGGSGEPATNSEWVGGTEIDIIFYDKNDYEDLKRSLKSIGLKRDGNIWILEDKNCKHEGETLISFKENKNGKYEIRLCERYHNGC